MIIRVHSFDWTIYAEHIMPAFARWLIEEDEDTIYNLYERTRRAHDEQFMPASVHGALIWPRARAFVRRLPRGPHTRHEYQLLCAAESFTELSDRYVHRRPPRLYQNSDALRAVWDALVEEYCLIWPTPAPNRAAAQSAPEATQGEVVSLLQSARLDALAQAIQEQTLPPAEDADETGSEEEEVAGTSGPPGVEIGRHPLTLALRGWLASLSIRAMVLFELLACGRRHLPFACRSDLDVYVGYLRPVEVWQLVECLRGVQPPAEDIAEKDFARFRQQAHPFRSIDEVLPPHAGAFLQAARQAAQQGAGLICSVH